MILVEKKDGTVEKWSGDKIVSAVRKSADRVMAAISDEDGKEIANAVLQKLASVIDLTQDNPVVPVSELHCAVESALDDFNPKIAESYRNYRNYKTDFVHIMDDVYKKAQGIRYIGDRDNANTDSALLPTQRSLIYNELNSQLYKKFFLNVEERQAMKDGYIYIHDRSARLDGINCSLFDMASVLKDGFEMGNVWYNEPKTLDVAFDVISDVAISAAACQYGGFTMPRIDSLLAPYAAKSYKKYLKEYSEIHDCHGETDIEDAESWASAKVRRDFEQGFQSWEYRFNTVGSSRGDYPFVAVSFGLDQTVFGRIATEVCLEVRKNGQGKEGFKKPVLFPKLTFLYDENLHGKGKPLEYLFDCAIECSKASMYPDFLSCTGSGYIPSMYKKYGKVVSLMGCVDGNEIITYKYKNVLYVESFRRMWDRLGDYFKKQQQIDGCDEHLYMIVDGVFIYDTKNGFVPVKKIIRNTSDNWLNVKFSNGRSIKCTTDHPFPTNRGRILARDLQLNDTITINNSQYCEESVHFDDDKAWLLGFLICDGCYDNRVTASIAFDSENDIEEAYTKRMKSCFDVDVKVVEHDRGNKGKYKDLNSIGCVSDTIDYLSTKFEGLTKMRRHIPNEVFSWNKDAKLNFMAGMIDADGYINPDAHGGSIVQIGSTNKELALQQMELAQSLGMQAAMYQNKYCKSNPNLIRYRVEFVPTKDLINCLVSNKKKNNYKERTCATEYKSCATVNSVDVIDCEGYSYDVETESDHFEVSGIYSHNCRASLSPWYERGGMDPADKNDTPVFEGRFNLGAISLHLPMILAKARQENKDFYEVLDYYLELIRNLHKKTYDFLGEKKAGTNPLGFCQGGFLGGHLDPEDKIRDLLPPMTMSFGITALNELQELYNGKSLVEDGAFALEVMKYINKRIDKFKKEDHILFAVYATPAESLAGLQVEQFRKLYGIVRGVSDRAYVSNSFHCGVWEDITPIQKQDLESRFWDYFNGGKIQYCKYPIDYNTEAIKTLVRRAMKMGFYEGINLSLSYCEECGYQQLDMDVCPKCGSHLVTKIERMNGLT